MSLARSSAVTPSKHDSKKRKPFVNATSITLKYPHFPLWWWMMKSNPLCFNGFFLWFHDMKLFSGFLNNYWFIKLVIKNMFHLFCLYDICVFLFKKIFENWSNFKILSKMHFSRYILYTLRNCHFVYFEKLSLFISPDILLYVFISSFEYFLNLC